MKVTFDDLGNMLPEDDRLMVQPALFPGMFGEVRATQRHLFDVGRSERKPAAKQPDTDEGGLYQ